MAFFSKLNQRRCESRHSPGGGASSSSVKKKESAVNSDSKDTKIRASLAARHAAEQKQAEKAKKALVVRMFGWLVGWLASWLYGWLRTTPGGSLHPSQESLETFWFNLSLDDKAKVLSLEGMSHADDLVKV